jgi:hypothetical protein
MVILVMIILIMLIWGGFSKEGQIELPAIYKGLLMAITFIGIILIVLWNLGWLQMIYAYSSTNLDGPVVGSIALLIIVLGFMFWIYSGDSPAEKKA